jgi:hypothetical protein
MSSKMPDPFYYSIKAILKESPRDVEFYCIDWEDFLFPYAQKAYGFWLSIYSYKSERNCTELWWRLDAFYFGQKLDSPLEDSK